MKKNFTFASLLIACLVFLAAACTSSKQTASQDACAKSPVTYTSTMKSIIDTKCAGCHQAGKKAARDGVFTSYKEMSASLSHMYHEAVEEKAMPPSKATQLTAEELAAWKCWQKNGYKE